MLGLVSDVVVVVVNFIRSEYLTSTALLQGLKQTNLSYYSRFPLISIRIQFSHSRIKPKPPGKRKII